MGMRTLRELPDYSTQQEIVTEGGSFEIGVLDKYIRRLSFFYLEVRDIGSNAWFNLTGIDRPFGVLGDTPQAMFNSIRVSLKTAAMKEFRFRPLSGNYFRATLSANTPRYVRILDANPNNNNARQTFDVGGLPYSIHGL